MWHSPSNGEQLDEASAGSLKRALFFTFFNSFFLSKVERLSIKAFLKVTLILLTLRAHPFSKNFEKTQPTLLYWFPAQQQTTTSRRQKFDLFSSKFSL